MNPIKAQIIDKLNYFEQVSPATLQSVLDFVSYLESRLKLNSEINQDSHKTYLAFDLDNLDAAYAEMAVDEEQELESKNGEVIESPDELFTTWKD